MGEFEIIFRMGGGEKKNSKTISFLFCTRLFKHAFRFPMVKATVHKREKEKKEKKRNSEIDGNKKKSESKRNPRTRTPLHNKLERARKIFTMYAKHKVNLRKPPQYLSEPIYK